MEVGPASELTVLTPGEVGWIERALGARDTMAREMLTQGKGRATGCNHTDGTAGCGKTATHYTVSTESGELTGYCLEHWRTDADPNNTLKLDSAAGTTPRPA